MPGYIYFMQNPRHPMELKIGFSKNPAARVKQLYRTGNPMPFSVRALWWVSNMDLAEKNIHVAFAEHRVNPRREFFDVVPQDSLLALEIADNPDDIESCLQTLIELTDFGLEYLSTHFSDFEFHQVYEMSADE